MKVEEEIIISEEEIIDFKELIVLIRKMHVHFQQICALPPGELSMLIVLERLHKKQEIIVASDLVRLMSLSRPAVSRMLHVLEKKGYICLEESARDHRLVRIILSEAGKELLRNEEKKYHEELTYAIRKVGDENIKKMLYYNFRFFKSLSQELGIDQEEL